MHFSIARVTQAHDARIVPRIVCGRVNLYSALSVPPCCGPGAKLSPLSPAFAPFIDRCGPDRRPRPIAWSECRRNPFVQLPCPRDAIHGISPGFSILPPRTQRSRAGPSTERAGCAPLRSTHTPPPRGANAAAPCIPHATPKTAAATASVCEDILLPGLACEQLLAALPPLAGLLILSPFAKALDRNRKKKTKH